MKAVVLLFTLLLFSTVMFSVHAKRGGGSLKGLGRGPRCVDGEGNVTRPDCACEAEDGSLVGCKSDACPGKGAKTFTCSEADGSVINYGNFNMKFMCPVEEEELTCACDDGPVDCTLCPTPEWVLQCSGESNVFFIHIFCVSLKFNILFARRVPTYVHRRSRANSTTQAIQPEEMVLRGL